MWRLALADFGHNLHSSDSLRGVVFPKKRKKMLTKFPGLATLGGRLNGQAAMVRDRRKFTSEWSLCGMSCFHFYP